MIIIRRARPADATAIGAVHVAAWRSTYAGILPRDYLTRLSAVRQAAHYQAAIRGGIGVYVAIHSDSDPASSVIVGFATAGRARQGAGAPADGEIETLYVLDDWRDRGIGRRLMRAAVDHLGEMACQAVFLWVLRDNPSRWFYARLGGRPAAETVIQVGGQDIIQTAYVWTPIDRLAEATATER